MDWHHNIASFLRWLALPEDIAHASRALPLPPVLGPPGHSLKDFLIPFLIKEEALAEAPAPRPLPSPHDTRLGPGLMDFLFDFLFKEESLPKREGLASRVREATFSLKLLFQAEELPSAEVVSAASSRPGGEG